MSIKELESAVSNLPEEELGRFARWFEEYLSDVWDQTIEADALAGRLDAAGDKAIEQFEAGLCKPL